MSLLMVPASGSVTLTEPDNTNLSQTVTLTWPASGSDSVGVVVITDVTCDIKPQMVNAGSALSITKAGSAFTFSDQFKDLFSRVFKYSKTFDYESVRWNDIEIDNPVITTYGTDSIKVKTALANTYRVGDTVTIAVDEIVVTDKTKLNGTYKITSVGTHKNNNNIGENDTFKEFTVKLTQKVPSGTFTLRTTAYNTYHTCNRVRYVKQMDDSIKADKFTGVYNYNPTTSPITITFNISYTVTYVSGLSGTPVVQNQTASWSFTLNPSYALSIKYLDEVSSSSVEAIKAAAYNTKLGIL